jgi:hypothetical protein
MIEEAWRRMGEEVGWAALADWGQAECSLSGGAKRWKSALVGCSLESRCFELSIDTTQGTFCLEKYHDRSGWEERLLLEWKMR